MNDEERRRDWIESEEESNKRMDIIGSNGNTGEHYDIEKKE